MNKETAIMIRSQALNAISNLTLILNTLPDDTPTEDVNLIKRGIGLSIGMIQTDLLEIINAQYPELDDLTN